MKRKTSNRDIEKAHISALDTLLAWHAAPTLLYMKTASLFACSAKMGDIIPQIKQFNDNEQGRDLLIRVLHQNEKRQWLYIYNRSMLIQDLKRADTVAFLEQLGYSRRLSVDKKLDQLSRRIAESKEFPHEIGLFLGYPVVDVAGFIKNKGHNSLANGCWIVYSNAQQAKKKFDCFHICREYICQKMEQGFSLSDVLKHVHEAYI